MHGVRILSVVNRTESMLWVFLIFIMLIPGTLCAQDSLRIRKQRVFEEVFGDAVKLDPDMVEMVKNDVPGKRHYFDVDGDGKPDEVWFIDTDSRHNQKNRPILVRVIDENKNLEYGKEPDKSGDLWIADWNADGMIDAVISYEDLDGDGDMDQMGMFFYDHKYGLRVWWFIDDGDDNLLGYDIDYIYYQIPCQNHSHFGGNESLISMYYQPETGSWIPFWENPFLFYDSDDDGITEEVIRIEGEGDIMRFLRWSFNVHPITGHPRNFDVGITACAPGWDEELDKNSHFTFRLPPEHTESFSLRGRPTGSVVKRSTARDVLRTMPWARVLMTWDENDMNTAWDRPGDKIERWEGIISSASREPGYYMPQVGGPDCGPNNKRYALVLQPQGANRFYYNPSDQRIHILQSDKTWLNVDYNGDLKTDMFYRWLDTNGDGIMGRIEIDIDGDEQTDDSYDLVVSEIQMLVWTFDDLNAQHLPVLQFEPERKYRLILSLTTALKSQGKMPEQDPVMDFLENRLVGQGYSEELSERLLHSDESILYYLRLVQDRLIFSLKESGIGSRRFWKQFNNARSRGDTQSMTWVVGEYFRLGETEADYSTWIALLRKGPDKPLVAWENQWLPPNWGWESEKVAFRFYDGHFDLFGKRIDTLIYPGIKEGKNYHRDVNGWGMDILHVGNSSGIGGLTLYVNGVALPVRNDQQGGAPIFESRRVFESNQRMELEFVTQITSPDGENYTVRIAPSIDAGLAKSDIRVTIEGGNPSDTLELGIGLTRLTEEEFVCDQKAGYMASWGIQEPEIGWIGLGIIFPPDRFVRMEHDDQEHRVILRGVTNDPVHYAITGEWLKGTRFRCCPTAPDWFNRTGKMTLTP